MLNFGLNFDLVLRSSGSNFGSGPNFGPNETQHPPTPCLPLDSTGVPPESHQSPTGVPPESHRTPPDSARVPPHSARLRWSGEVWWDSGGTPVGLWWDSGGTLVGLYESNQDVTSGGVRWDSGRTLVGLWWDSGGFLCRVNINMSQIKMSHAVTDLRSVIQKVCLSVVGV